MGNKIVKTCPVCGGEMYVSGLTCDACGIEIKGHFDPSQDADSLFPFDEEEARFVKVFLKREGNLSRVGEELGMSFFEVKSKLKKLNQKMGNEEEESMNYVNHVAVRGDGKKASDVIIEKMNAVGGKTECPMLRGGGIEIRLTDNGVHPTTFKDFVCEWRIFDAIVDKARELGGKMYRGDAAAQNGARIGSDELPLDTIDAFISLKFYDGEVGKTTLRRSTYYAAILAWAGICENCRSDGNGGYIRLR